MPNLAYEFLDTETAISGYLDALRRERSVAVDMEADSLYSYREKVCLVQVSAAGANTILDPLACPDALAGLGPLVADGTVEKIFHGGDYDVRLLKKQYGFHFRNVFDTAVAAQFTGRARFGLAALLEEFFGVQLDKKHQRANWSARPLKPELLSYAALDTAYLTSLRSRLQEELRDLGRLEWAREEFRLLEAVNPVPPRPPRCLDLKGACKLPPRQLALLQALLEVRDASAREWDRPPFKVLSNQVLLAWAREPPANRKEVVETSGAGRAILGRLAEQILAAVRTADGLPLCECPRPKLKPHDPLGPGQAKRLERLKRARARAVERLGLPAGFVVNTATLERLARKSPEQAVDCLEKQLKNWQIEAIGEDLRRVLRA
jgi:ribonuclease D